MLELPRRIHSGRWKVNSIGGIDPIEVSLSGSRGRVSIAKPAADPRQEIERVRHAGNTHDFSRPTSGTDGTPLTKGVRRADCRGRPDEWLCSK